VQNPSRYILTPLSVKSGRAACLHSRCEGRKTEGMEGTPQGMRHPEIQVPEPKRRGLKRPPTEVASSATLIRQEAPPRTLRAGPPARVRSDALLQRNGVHPKG
jgi:hypothetical protein